MTSPSYTSLFSCEQDTLRRTNTTVTTQLKRALMRRPMARRKFSIRISVFFTSDENTSEPTMGQNGTCEHTV